MVVNGNVSPPGVPTVLTAKPLRTFRTRDAGQAYAHPRPQVARLERQGVIHRIAHGLYVVVPPEHVGTAWMPTLEAAAAGAAAALFGARRAPLMSISAARIYGAIPRAVATAVVAAPRQHEVISLLDRSARIVFVARDTARLDVRPAPTDLGDALVTTIEQTVLDLARRPSPVAVGDQLEDAVRALLPRCDDHILTELAADQRLRSALIRARGWAQQ